MITIHATKKLLAKLPVNEQGLLPKDRRFDDAQLAGSSSLPSMLGSWHANLLTIQRRNCVLFVHDDTRFPVFIPALTKPHFARLDLCFEDALANTLLKCGANDQQLDKLHAAFQPLQFDSVCNRSVQGTMNRVGQDADWYLHYDGVKVAEITGYRLSAELADQPCNVKGQKDCIWPKAAFLALIDGLPDSLLTERTEDCAQDQTSSADNVISLDSFRKPE